MKKTLVIVVHPTLSTSTINKAWSEAACGHATLHFLYDAYPNGASFDIAAEQALIEAHDRIVFQFPLYWHAAPYLLKKWLDEVITYGWAYGEGGDKMEGKELAELLNPESLKVLSHAKVETFLHDAAVGAHYQFQRIGYFVVDKDTAKEGRLILNRTTSLKDTWGKIATKK